MSYQFGRSIILFVTIVFVSVLISGCSIFNQKKDSSYESKNIKKAVQEMHDNTNDKRYDLIYDKLQGYKNTGDTIVKEIIFNESGMILVFLDSAIIHNDIGCFNWIYNMKDNENDVRVRTLVEKYMQATQYSCWPVFVDAMRLYINSNNVNVISRSAYKQCPALKEIF